MHLLFLTFLFLEMGEGYFGPFQPYRGWGSSEKAFVFRLGLEKRSTFLLVGLMAVTFSCSDQRGSWVKKQHQKQLSRHIASSSDTELWNDDSLPLTPNSTWAFPTSTHTIKAKRRQEAWIFEPPALACSPLHLLNP